MNFISQNVFLIIIALASGGMLLWQAIRGGGGTALGALAATQLINQKGAQVPGARHVMPDKVQTFAAGVDASKPILLVCANGVQSAKASKALKASGRSEVYSLEGGIDAWQQAGLPLVNPKDKA